uniref:(+)-neomenthol dehydrogenase n=1 Tax=Solanum tuberosum TaxID=4113 RepID=M1AND9_SOLTU
MIILVPPSTISTHNTILFSSLLIILLFSHFFFEIHFQLVSNEWAIKALSDEKSLTTEKVDEIVNEFLCAFKEGVLEEKGWPIDLAAYKVSKVAMNAHTRIVAQKYSSICVNCICPGFVNTDITCNTGPMTPEEAAKGPIGLALLPDGGPSGHFFYRKNIPISF